VITGYCFAGGKTALHEMTTRRYPVPRSQMFACFRTEGSWQTVHLTQRFASGWKRLVKELSPDIYMVKYTCVRLFRLYNSVLPWRGGIMLFLTTLTIVKVMYHRWNRVFLWTQFRSCSKNFLQSMEVEDALPFLRERTIDT
jgi:hypothetical protein